MNITLAAKTGIWLVLESLTSLFLQKKFEVNMKRDLECYFVANDIKDAGKKEAMLITSIGSSNHLLLRSIMVPGKLADKSYDDLVKVLQDHFSPAPSEIMQ